MIVLLLPFYIVKDYAQLSSGLLLLGGISDLPRSIMLYLLGFPLDKLLVLLA